MLFSDRVMLKISLEPHVTFFPQRLSTEYAALVVTAIHGIASLDQTLIRVCRSRLLLQRICFHALYINADTIEQREEIRKQAAPCCVVIRDDWSLHSYCGISSSHVV